MLVLHLVSWRTAGVFIAFVALAESWTSQMQRQNSQNNRLFCQQRNPALPTATTARFASLVSTTSTSTTRLQLSTNNPEVEDDAAVDRTTFDQAGASLIEEDDQKRMEQMGDFDLNPSSQTDNIERMRAVIRARTAEMGLEKSRVSAEYIESKKERAIQSGPSGPSDPDQFAGLDLSKISSERAPSSSSSQWNEDMPSMFYDPEDELTLEEQEEADPIMKLNPVDQGLNELRNAKWPDMGSALREVVLMLVVVALSAVLIIGWDKILREVYTTLGFIPTKEDIANYASRFDGLDLPKGWTDNMSEQDVSSFADAVNMNQPSLPSSSASLPDL